MAFMAAPISLAAAGDKSLGVTSAARSTFDLAILVTWALATTRLLLLSN
jgi:hypothetical protein